MTQQQMIEMVRQHHPEIGITQVRLWLNQAIEEFCRKTMIIKDVDTSLTSVTDTRWYDIPTGVLGITSLDFDGYTIPRIYNRPEKRDLV